MASGIRGGVKEIRNENNKKTAFSKLVSREQPFAGNRSDEEVEPPEHRETVGGDIT